MPDRTGNNLVELPPGRRVLAGVEFQIPVRWIQLHAGLRPDFPRIAAGIPVNRPALRLFILHGTQVGEPRRELKDGVSIAAYRVRYTDGDSAEIPVVMGEDVRDWWASRPETTTRGQVAWVGGNPATRPTNIYLRLYLCTWENPHPEKRIATIDYVAVHSSASPFCVAIMAEEPLSDGGPEASGRRGRSP
jgi:hypothetical protein